MRGGTRVVDAQLHERPLNDSRQRVRRWWVLKLECGHIVERAATYRRVPGAHRQPRRGPGDVLPAQTSAYCDQCPTAAAHDEARLRIRAAPALAASWAAALRSLVPGLTVEGPAFRAAGFVDYYARTRTPPPAPHAGPVAGSLVDLAARAAARARSRHRGDDFPADRLARYADGLARDHGYRVEIAAALQALAAAGYLRQRPDQEGSEYGEPTPE